MCAVRPRGKWQPVVLPDRRSKHGVHKPRRARLSRQPRQIDGVIDNRGRWNPRQVEELVQAEAQDEDDVCIELCQGSFREVADEMVGDVAEGLGGEDGVLELVEGLVVDGSDRGDEVVEADGVVDLHGFTHASTVG